MAPTSALTSLTTAPTGNDAQDFKAAIQESKAVIHEAAMQKVKGSRGRKPLPRDANGNIIRESAPVVNGASLHDSGSTTLTPQNQIDHSQLLVTPIQILSSIPARKHDIEELAFNDEEARALAQSLDKVFNAYFPDIEKMSPKAAAWISFGMVGVSLTVSKVSIYQAVMSERRKHAVKVNKVEVNEAGQRVDVQERAGEPGSTSTRTGKVAQANLAQPSSFMRPDNFGART